MNNIILKVCVGGIRVGLYYRGKRLVGLVLICSGSLILMLIILPFWAWLSLAAIGLIWGGIVLFKRF
jgi:hypothetical protein